MAGKHFRDITTAPGDGSLIEVLHGPTQEPVLARWSGQGQAFVADNDPLRRSLHRVSLWRPAKSKAGQGPLTPLVQPKQPATGAVIVVSRMPRRRYR
jgi:hypothetical protein